MAQHDIIIIGSGINSLVCAAVLGKAGKKVLVLEARNKIGGLASTNEFAPGFKCNVIHDTVKWIDPRVSKELQVESQGLELVDLDVKRIALGSDDNEHILFHQDPLITSESIRKYSNKDADKWEDFIKHIDTLRNKLIFFT